MVVTWRSWSWGMTLVVVTDQPELMNRAGDDSDPDAVEAIQQPPAAAREEAEAPTSPQVAWADSSEPAVASEPDVDATPTRSHYTEEELAQARSLSLPEDRAAALCSSADPETAAASQVRPTATT